MPQCVKAKALLPVLYLLLLFASASGAGAQAVAAPASSSDISGTYSFLREGEFVQLTVEDGQVSGFVSRFGDEDNDKSVFLDQFFEKASLQNNHLVFKTTTVHAVFYEFNGTVNTAAGKQPGEEGYRKLQGKLTLHRSDASGNEQVSERSVELKSFPDAAHIRASH